MPAAKTKGVKNQAVERPYLELRNVIHAKTLQAAVTLLDAYDTMSQKGRDLIQMGQQHVGTFFEKTSPETSAVDLPGEAGIAVFDRNWNIIKVKDLNDVTLFSDMESIKKQNALLLNALPTQMAACMPSLEKKNALSLMKKDLELQHSAAIDYSGFFSPKLLAQARTITFYIRTISGFEPFNNDKQTFFEDTVAFALLFDIKQKDILSIAEALSTQKLSLDDFGNSFMVVTVLRVARKLHKMNIAAGKPGLLEDFYLDSLSVDSSILSGNIKIRTKSLGDSVFEQNTAFYDPKQNELVFFPFVGRRPSPVFFFDTIIHESVHAWQDIKRFSGPRAEVEEMAYKCGIRASAMLFDSVKITYRETVEFFYPPIKANSKIFRDISNETNRQTALCTVFDEQSIISYFKIIGQEKSFLFGRWKDAIAKTNPIKPEIPFIEAAALRYLDTDSFKSRALFGEKIQNGEIEDPISVKNELQKKHDDALDAFLASNIRSPKGGAAALEYIGSAKDLLGIVYYLDRTEWLKLQNEILDLSWPLAIANMYVTIKFDGVDGVSSSGLNRIKEYVEKSAAFKLQASFQDKWQ